MHTDKPQHFLAEKGRKIPIQGLFFFRGIRFVVNSEDFVLPIKFEIKLLLNGNPLGNFECYKEWLAGRRDYSKEAFAILDKAPLDARLDYSNNKLEFIFIKELPYQRSILSPLSISEALGTINFTEYLYRVQKENNNISDKAIKSIEKEYYIELREKIKNLLERFNKMLNERLKTQPYVIEADLIVKIDWCHFKLELRPMPLKHNNENLLITLDDKTFNNYISTFYKDIYDDFDSRSKEIVIATITFALFETLSLEKHNLSLHNINTSFIVSVHLPPPSDKLRNPIPITLV